MLRPGWRHWSKPRLTHRRWTATNGVDAGRAARDEVRGELAQRAPLEWGLMKSIRNALPRNTIVASDPHLLGYWSREHLPFYEPRTWLYGLAFGTLGYSYPVALGAKIVAPDRPVISLTGDGGFLFTRAGNGHRRTAGAECPRSYHQ